MKTKYGTANIYNGYYVITSYKEGNHNKYLHRLIWADFWKTEVPQGYHIHHKNHIKTDNSIRNLQLMEESEHKSLHNTGENNCRYWKDKTFSEEHKQKISEANNTSGYLNVYKQKCKSCNQGFMWKYQYYEYSKRKAIYSTSINKLEAKVKSKGLLWKKLKSGEF